MPVVLQLGVLPRVDVIASSSVKEGRGRKSQLLRSGASVAVTVAEPMHFTRNANEARVATMVSRTSPSRVATVIMVVDCCIVVRPVFSTATGTRCDA